MTQSELPMYETPEQALIGAVQMLGGSKKIGPMLWPDKSVEAASQRLVDCLNPSRTEKLDLSQAVLILRMAREVGIYAPFQWVAAECGFDALPISREEEIDRVASVVEQSTQTLAKAVQTLERLQRVRGVA